MGLGRWLGWFFSGGRSPASPIGGMHLQAPAPADPPEEVLGHCAARHADPGQAEVALPGLPAAPVIHSCDLPAGHAGAHQSAVGAWSTPPVPLRVLQYPAARENYAEGPADPRRPIDRLVIHLTEGSYEGALSWFATPRPKAPSSAHFVVRARDGQVSQAVPLKDIAYHAGNGSWNFRSIGIEHEGYVARPDLLTDALYRQGAALAAELCVTLAIPIDRQHLVGHNEVPDPNHPGEFGGAGHHDDPGPHWDWDRYLALVLEAAQAFRPARPELMAKLFRPPEAGDSGGK